MTRSLAEPKGIPSGAMTALGYQAPFLVEKLLQDRIVDTADEACALFTEVKRYLILSQADQTKTWTMHSRRVDEAWHQFMLYSIEYTDFCVTYFGRYLHHSPSNAPEQRCGHRTPKATLAEFAERYREIFDIDLSAIWTDSSCITMRRRVLNDHCGQLALRPTGAMVDLVGQSGRILVSISDIADEALDFIAATGAFYVRELPGGLTDEEKVALVTALVDIALLRIG